MRKIDGSLTVEAALIIPLLLFLIVIADPRRRRSISGMQGYG